MKLKFLKYKSKKLLMVYMAVILLVVGVSFALTYVGQSTKKQDTNTTATIITLSPTPILSIHSCSENECVIEELGIKFATPDGLNDLVYIADKKHAYASFSTRSLMNHSSECTPSAIGGLSRINKSELDESSGNWRTRESELKRSAHAKEFSDFYILYEGPQSVCSSTKKDADMQTAQLQMFKNVVSNIELLK
jgi:hypothetical protein